MNEIEQKQIEKMANIMGECSTTCDKCFEKLERVMTMKIKEREEHCQVYLFAKRAIEQGYRKLPENSIVLTEEKLKEIALEEYKKALKDKVVLSKEELNMLIDNIEKSSEIKAEELEKVRKETAREFYDKIIWFGVKRIGQTTSDSYIQISLERLAEITKEYEAEVE